MSNTDRQVRIMRADKDKDHPYYVASRNAAQDNRISFGARGLLHYLLSKPDDWSMLMADLEKQSPREHGSAVRTYVKELREVGYVHYKNVRNELGRFTPYYEVYESPRGRDPSLDVLRGRAVTKARRDGSLHEPHSGFPHADNPLVDKPHVENRNGYSVQTVLSTDIQSTEAEGEGAPRPAAAPPPSASPIPVPAASDSQPTPAKPLRQRTAKEPKPVKDSIPDETMTHPAIVAYRDEMKLTPDPDQRRAIIQAVGPNLLQWQATVRAWHLNGYRGQSIYNLLDRFGKDLAGRVGCNGRIDKFAPPPPCTRSPEEVDRENFERNAWLFEGGQHEAA